MELTRHLTVIRNRWRVLALVVIVALAAAWFLTPRQRVYKATTILYIGSRSIDFQNPNTIAYGGTAAFDRFILTFGDMIDSVPVAARAIDATGVDRSPASVVTATSATQVPNTQLLAVSVTDRDPTVARNLANGMAAAFVSEMQNFEPGRPATEGSLPSSPAYIFERAQLPTAPESTGVVLNLAVALLLALTVGVAGILLRDYLDLTLRGIEDAERRVELPVLGAIPSLGSYGRRSILSPLGRTPAPTP